MLIIDGMGDLPVAKLGQRTPLEAAHTPVLDRLAAFGTYGLLDPIAPGVTPNTHSGTGNLFGLSPEKASSLNRGPVEAAGLALEISPDDIVLRSNFASLDQDEDGLVVIDRRAGRIADGVDDLADALLGFGSVDGVRVSLFPTDQHRGALVLSGEGLDPNISDTDPGNRPMPARLLPCKAQTSAAERTAEIVNRVVAFAYQRLRDHPLNSMRIAAGLPPANGIITRGAGNYSRMNGLISRLGLSASLVTGCNTVGGLGQLFGFNVVPDSRFTGTAETDLDAKVETALAELQQHDLVYLHIKAPDIFAHDLDPQGKRDFFERIDRAIRPLQHLSAVIGVAADHSTDSNTGFHTSDPVPSLLCSPGSNPIVQHVNFGESSCRKGNRERDTSHHFLLEFIRRMGLDPSHDMMD